MVVVPPKCRCEEQMGQSISNASGQAKLLWIL